MAEDMTKREAQQAVRRLAEETRDVYMALREFRDRDGWVQFGYPSFDAYLVGEHGDSVRVLFREMEAGTPAFQACYRFAVADERASNA